MVAAHKSTNVRIYAAAELKALAAMFFVPRKRFAAGEWLGWERLEVQFEDGALLGYARGEGRAVLPVHGWEGGAAQMKPLGDALANRGLRAFAFDMPGHGQSPGAWSSLPHFFRAAREIAARLGPLHAVVGHSLGGAAAMLAGLAVARVGLIASAEHPEHFVRGFAAMVGVSDSQRPELAEAISAQIGMPFEALHVAGAATRFAGELLAIHDPLDAEVPIGHGRTIVQAAAKARLLELEGAGHRRIAGDARAIEAMVEFLAK